MSDDLERRLTAGFVGLGTMGWPMAANLHAAGFPLIVRDVSAETQDRFVAEHPGALGARSPADFGPADLVVTMLPDGAVVRDALLGWGIAAALRPGAVALDMSSSDPADTLRLATELEPFGIGVVDAPVSGGAAGTATMTPHDLRRKHDGHSTVSHLRTCHLADKRRKRGWLSLLPDTCHLTDIKPVSRGSHDVRY